MRFFPLFHCQFPTLDRSQTKPLKIHQIPSIFTNLTRLSKVPLDNPNTFILQEKPHFLSFLFLSKNSKRSVFGAKLDGQFLNANNPAAQKGERSKKGVVCK